MALGPAESFSHYVRDTKHPLLVRLLAQGARWLPAEVMEALQRSDRTISTSDIAYPPARCAYNRKRPEASRPTGAAGCVIPSWLGVVVYASGQCSQVRTGGACRPPTGLRVSHRHAPGGQLKCPTSNFTHLVLGENPQLAAPVAVQFQNSEARLLQSHLEEGGQLF